MSRSPTDTEYHFAVRGVADALWGLYEHHSGWSAVEVKRTDPPLNLPWHPWFPVTDRPEDPNHAKFSTATPPVALARDAEHQDLFVMGTDGRVWTTYWSLGDQGWHPWFPVTDRPEDPNHAKFSTATPPVALARDAEHQDLFVMGTDGRVWTTYWSLGDQGWHPWFPVTDRPEDPNHAKFSTATPPVALARDAEHQDLFVMGTDGRVWTTYWSLGDQGWHPWFPVTDRPEDPNHAKFSTATPPVALARDAEHQDLFVMGTDGRVWTTYWSLGDQGWHPWFPVTDRPEDPNHAKFSTATPPVALARDAEHQDLFVTGTDGRVWTTYWSLGDQGWHPWFPVTDRPEDPNHAKFSTATPPVALARDAEHQDLFVMGTDGRVWTTYWSLGDQGWHPWFPITDDPSQPTIATFSTGTAPAALARDPQHQDVFVMGTDERVWTSYWAG